VSWRAGIHGYAAKWGVVTATPSRPHGPHLARPVRFERDCFSYDAATVGVWFMHREAQKVGTGAQLGLQIWSDDYGLAFSFKPPSTAWSLVCGISDGRYDRCSVGCVINAASTQDAGGVVFDSIAAATLDEISICPRGACPGAVCWHAAAEPWTLRPHAAAVLPIWEASRVMCRQAA
jgi:phage head maturation protease